MKSKLEFGLLFKKYRLRSELKTLSELGKFLAESGLVYEDSTFSRWEKGNRTPKARSLLLTLIKLFIEKGGISSLKEANEFLESAKHGYLTVAEIESLPRKIHTQAPFQVPSEIASFTGRKGYLERIKRDIFTERVVLIHGSAGVGKTSFAIRLGNFLRQDFPDGVLWYRVDTSDSMSILSAMAYAFKENINEIKDIEIRASVVRSLLSPKKCLIILDNADLETPLHLLLPNSRNNAVLITSRYQNLKIPTSYSSVLLNSFTPEESLILFKNILSGRYVERNKLKLLGIADMLGNLPLAIHIFAKQLSQPSKNIKILYDQLLKEKVALEVLQYEDRNFYISVNMSFKNLKRNIKNVFVSLGVFGGKDFSCEAVAFINGIKINEAENILEELTSWSLVERSTKKRYRVHPLLKVFVQEKMNNRKLCNVAAMYFEEFLQKCGRGNQKHYPQIGVELDNILSIFNKCFELKFYDHVVKLWECLGVFLWDTGLWHMVEILGQKVYKAAFSSKNFYAQALCCIRELSWFYYWKGDIEIAERLTTEGLKIAKGLTNDFLIAYAIQRLGKIYQSKRQFNKADKLLKQSLNIFSKLNEFERAGDTLTYLGEQHILTNDLKKAQDYLTKAFKLTRKINDVNQNAIVLGSLGELHYLMGSYRKARECFQKSLSVTKIKGMNVGGKVWCNIGLALLENKTGNHEEVHRAVQKVQEKTFRLGIWYDTSRPLIVEYNKLLARLKKLPITLEFWA